MLTKADGIHIPEGCSVTMYREARAKAQQLGVPLIIDPTPRPGENRGPDQVHPWPLADDPRFTPKAGAA